MSTTEAKRGALFVEHLGFIVECCCNCGVYFAMTRETHAARKSDGNWFCCPMGHWQQYTETTETKLKRELAQATQRLDQAQADAQYQKTQRLAAEAAVAKAEAAKARMKRRAVGGLCTCCNRYFPNVHRHMSTEHPEKVKGAGVMPAVKMKKGRD